MCLRHHAKRNACNTVVTFHNISRLGGVNALAQIAPGHRIGTADVGSVASKNETAVNEC